MSDPRQPQSLLSEAVEQAAQTGSVWWDDLTKFAEDQADRLSSGHYGLTDLTTAQVELLRIWFRNSRNAVRTAIDNVAMLTYDGPTGGTATRSVQVLVPVAADTGVVFQVSELVGAQYRIPVSRIHPDPPDAPAMPAAREVPVTVTVECAGVPADLYSGAISSADGSVSVAFLVAIDEIGVPIP